MVMPRCDNFAMAQHLDEISAAVDDGCHAVLVLDKAGWHTSEKLSIPSNITLMPFRQKHPNSTRRKRVAVHAPELALESNLQILRGHCRSMLRGPEQTDQPTVEDYVTWNSGMGQRVLIKGDWYL